MEALLWEYVKVVIKEFLNALANNAGCHWSGRDSQLKTLLRAEITPVWVARELEFAIFSSNFCKCNYCSV